MKRVTKIFTPNGSSSKTKGEALHVGDQPEETSTTNFTAGIRHPISYDSTTDLTDTNSSSKSRLQDVAAVSTPSRKKPTGLKKMVSKLNLLSPRTPAGYSSSKKDKISIKSSAAARRRQSVSCDGRDNQQATAGNVTTSLPALPLDVSDGGMQLAPLVLAQQQQQLDHGSAREVDYEDKRLSERLSISHPTNITEAPSLSSPRTLTVGVLDSSNSSMSQQQQQQRQQNVMMSPRARRLAPPSRDTTRQKTNTRRRASLGDDRSSAADSKGTDYRRRRIRQAQMSFETETDSISHVDVTDLLTSPTRLVINSSSHGLVETTMTKEELLSPMVTKVVKRLSNGNLFISPKVVESSTPRTTTATPRRRTEPPPNQLPPTTRGPRGRKSEQLPPTQLPSSLPFESAHTTNTSSNNSQITSPRARRTTGGRRRTSSLEGRTASRPQQMIPEADSVDLAMANKMNDVHGVKTKRRASSAVGRRKQSMDASSRRRNTTRRQTEEKRQSTTTAGGGDDNTSRKSGRKKKPRRKSGSHLPTRASEAEMAQAEDGPRTSASKKKPRRRRSSGNLEIPHDKEPPELLPLESENGETVGKDANEQATGEEQARQQRRSRRRQSTSNLPPDEAERRRSSRRKPTEQKRISSSAREHAQRERERGRDDRKKSTRSKRRKSKEGLRRSVTVDMVASTAAVMDQLQLQMKQAPAEVPAATAASVAAAETIVSAPSSPATQRRTSFSGDGTDFTDDPSLMSLNTLKQRLQIPTAASTTEDTVTAEPEQAMTAVPEKQPSQTTLGYSTARSQQQQSVEISQSSISNISDMTPMVPTEQKAKLVSPPLIRDKFWNLTRGSEHSGTGSGPARTRSNVELFKDNFVVAATRAQSPRSPRQRTVALEEKVTRQESVLTTSDHSSKAPSQNSAPLPSQQRQSPRLSANQRRAQSMSHYNPSLEWNGVKSLEDLASAVTPFEEKAGQEPSPTSVNVDGVFAFDFARNEDLNNEHATMMRLGYDSIHWEPLDSLPQSHSRVQRRPTLSCDGRDSFNADPWELIAKAAAELQLDPLGGAEPASEGASSTAIPLASSPGAFEGHEEDPADDNESEVETDEWLKVTTKSNKLRDRKDESASESKGPSDLVSQASLPMSSLASFETEDREDEDDNSVGNLFKVTTISNHLRETKTRQAGPSDAVSKASAAMPSLASFDLTENDDSIEGDMFNATSISRHLSENKPNQQNKWDAVSKTSAAVPSLASFDLTNGDDHSEFDSVDDDQFKATKISKHLQQTRVSNIVLADACDSVALARGNRPLATLASFSPSEDSTVVTDEIDSQGDQADMDSVGDLFKATTISKHLNPSAASRTGLSDACESVDMAKANMSFDSLEPSVTSDSAAEEIDSVGEMTEVFESNRKSISRHLRETKGSRKSISDACDSVVLSKALKNRPMLRSSYAARRRSLGDDTIQNEKQSMLNSFMDEQEGKGDFSPRLPKKNYSFESQLSSPLVNNNFASACDSVVLAQASTSSNGLERRISQDAARKSPAVKGKKQSSLSFIGAKQSPGKANYDASPKKPPRRSYSFESHFTSTPPADTPSFGLPFEDEGKETDLTQSTRTDLLSFDGEDSETEETTEREGDAGRFIRVKSCDRGMEQLYVRGGQGSVKRNAHQGDNRPITAHTHGTLDESLHVNHLHKSMPQRLADGTSPWGPFSANDDDPERGTEAGESNATHSRWSSS